MQESSVEPLKFYVECLDLDGALKAAKELRLLPEHSSYLIDFSKLSWFEPFGMLYFARQLRDFADSRKPATCQAVGHEKHGYAAYMGFFRTFGLEFGNEVGEAPGSSAYIPITELKIRELHLEAGQSQREVQEIIEMRCAKLATVLARNANGALHETLTYSLREILRNVTEHSNADSIWYAAQYWPSKNLVELSILDQGLGIRATLSRNPHLAISNDADALRLALLPGVSGRAFKGGPTLRKDEWANSGYGLYMTSQICSNGGSFTICSGEEGLIFSKGIERKLEVGFSGTAIRLCIYVPEVKSLNEAFSQFNELARTIDQRVPEPSRLTASMSSRMLSDHFPRD
ncbi:hypothetical protein [Undibacterium danionis]|uniref:ATP-binding protein n=1 Tax=Undibacterium danionis TaxID=1812100 RepID=A0ABV6IBB1_9BURK